MMAEHISSVLEKLHSATDQLFVTTNRFDLDQIEAAVTNREKVVSDLRELIAQHPDAFTPEDLARMQSCHSQGKRALEKLLETRRTGWTTATELAQNQYVLKSFARFGCSPANHNKI